MSRRFDPISNPNNGSNTNFDPKLHTFYMPTQNPQQILNYSFQTGEEFALQFIQERTVSKPQLVSRTKNVTKTLVPIMSPVGPKRQLSDNITVNLGGNGTKISGVSGTDELANNTSKSAESSSKIHQRITTNNYNFSKRKNIKFLCSFGGKFLPRPSDGVIRYVGGETHILQLRKDVSWKELFQKTTRLLNGPHIVKYHLPGEAWSVLILVSCDEDVHHMMEECDVLQSCEDKPRLFLFTSIDDEENYGVRSIDTDSEARFVTAINASISTGYGYTDADLGWSSGNNNEIKSRGPADDWDQLIFDMDSDFTNVTDKESKAQKKVKPIDEGNKKLNFKMKEKMDEINMLPDSGVKTISSIENSFGSIGASSLGYSNSKDDFDSLSYLSSLRNEPFSTLPRSDNSIEPTKEVLNNEVGLIEGGHVEHEVLVRKSEKGASFDGKERIFGSHEGKNIDELIGEKNNILRQNTIERSDPKNSVKSKELNAVKWHDDMALSSKEQSFKDNTLVENFQINRGTKLDSESPENKISHLSEENKTEISDSVLQPDYDAPAMHYSNMSWINEVLTTQTGYFSQAIGDDKLSLSEQEEFEQDPETNLLTVDPIGSDFDLSNVQIIRNEDLEDLRVLGSGAFGTVYHGKWRGTDVAIKRIKNSYFAYQSSDKLLEEFWREAAILSKLHHPNVLAFYGVVKDGPSGSLATVTEFMVSGSLKRVLTRRDRYLDQRKKIMLAWDAAIGMEYLHAKQVVHFDLKCDNLLVNLKDLSRPICKVADFGLAKMKETTMVSGGMRGTLPWMAPEQLAIDMRSSKVSEKIDVYSFGIVMWEILTCGEPYGDMHYAQVIVGIMNNTLRPPVPSSCDPEWRRLMEQCWAADPDQRPSFTEIASRLRSMLETCQQPKQTV